MRVYQNLTGQDKTVSFCSVIPHYFVTAGNRLIPRASPHHPPATENHVLFNIPPGSIFSFDEGELNGPAIEGLMASLGLTRQVGN